MAKARNCKVGDGRLSSLYESNIQRTDLLVFLIFYSTGSQYTIVSQWGLGLVLILLETAFRTTRRKLVFL